MPVLVIIAIACGVATGGAIATKGHYLGSQTAEALAFDASAYASASDCLTAASTAGAPLSACTKE
ncbi:MAG: hypothetical protein ACHQK9_15190 [Reyranellales bacterium]